MISSPKYGILLLLLLPLFTKAQLEADNWKFTVSNDYVNFNKATQPVIINVYTEGGTPGTTYSDKNGQLLFYSDGGTFCNRNFRNSPSTNPNAVSNGIPGQILQGTAFDRYNQKVLAVPYPEHDSLFFLFHINYDFLNNYRSQLLYSIVNMNMDSGRGGVEYVQRNIPLLGNTNVFFKLTAILHCNKKDIWIVGHIANSDKYFAYLVTASGISSTPVYSTGNFIPSINYPDSAGHPVLAGCIKVSPLGNKFAAAFTSYNFIELGDFDTQTGMVSNVKKIIAAPPPADTLYNPSFVRRFGYGPDGVEFSPSGQRLYVSSNYEVKTSIYMTGYLYQFDATLPTEAAIQSSQYFIDSIYNFRAGAIQLANNGKMYINFEGYLSEIANPENSGISCNYTPLLLPLGGAQSFSRPLPIFLQSYLRYPIIATGNCQFQNISFNIQNLVGVTSINWDFGDPASGPNNTSTLFSPTHIFSTQGIYTVKAVLQNSNGCGADTIIKVVSAGPFQVNLGADTTLCQGDTLKLRISIPSASYSWSNNSTDTMIRVTEPGTYWVRVNLGECFATDTIVVLFRGLPQFTLGADSVICNSASVVLAPNPNPPNVSFLWSTNATTPTITTSLAGEYWLRLTDNYGCKYRDTIKISYSQLPGFNLGPDSNICDGDTLLLNATVSGATGYLWSTGFNTPTIKAYQTDIYWCDVTKDGCTYRDSMMLTVKPKPVVNLGNDTTLCEDKTLVLTAANAGATYLWQDGSTNATYLVTQKGQYYVRATINGCITRSDTNIEYDLKPKFSLGADKLFCIGSSLTLDPKIDNVSYLWQDGATTKTYKVTQPGLYYLATSNFCGTATDSIILSKGVCELYVPNAFTPDGNSKNDIFKAGFGDNLVEFQMQIFNRYGQLVFKTSDKNKGWDGNVNGKPQQAGTYAWMIRYRIATSSLWQDIQGTVILFR